MLVIDQIDGIPQFTPGPKIQSDKSLFHSRTHCVIYKGCLGKTFRKSNLNHEVKQSFVFFNFVAKTRPRRYHH